MPREPKGLASYLNTYIFTTSTSNAELHVHQMSTKQYLFRKPSTSAHLLWSRSTTQWRSSTQTSASMLRHSWQGWEGQLAVGGPSFGCSSPCLGPFRSTFIIIVSASILVKWSNPLERMHLVITGRPANGMHLFAGTSENLPNKSICLKRLTLIVYLEY